MFYLTTTQCLQRRPYLTSGDGSRVTGRGLRLCRRSRSRSRSRSPGRPSLDATQESTSGGRPGLNGSLSLLNPPPLESSLLIPVPPPHVDGISPCLLRSNPRFSS